MKPIVTPQEMAAFDAAAPEPEAELIARAGAAVARAALRLLGGTYGRRVVVLAGPGNNGADGRVAAARLAGQGVSVTVVEPGATSIPPADLVIDAAFGTGLSREWNPPATAAPVLAVDIPSGVDGLTGERLGAPWPAVATVTFAALKPGLLLGDGATLAGNVMVADIGLDVSASRAHLVDVGDLDLPTRTRSAHKWKDACLIVAGSGGMMGAARLTSGAAMRAGAGYVRLSTPAGRADAAAPVEVVVSPIPEDFQLDATRFSSVVIGPGLGLDEVVAASVRRAVADLDVPVVVDGDGLTALGARATRVCKGRSVPAVLTPHDGEFERLVGTRPDADRIAAARRLAHDAVAVVLLKGPTTIVAGPGGDVRVVMAGDPRLATAGTGDVLSGIIGALLARGVPPLEAAASGAVIHGEAARRCPAEGMIASDLLDAIPAVLS